MATDAALPATDPRRDFTLLSFQDLLAVDQATLAREEYAGWLAAYSDNRLPPSRQSIHPRAVGFDPRGVPIHSHLFTQLLSTTTPMKTLSTTWTGIRPLMLHNGLMADPTNPYTRQIKAITSKKTKTDADHEAVARLEWEAGLYRNESGALVPSDNIERCIQLGAQKNRLGKDVAAAVFVSEPEVAIEYEGPRKLDAMYADPHFVLRKGVKVTTARIVRVRPMIPTKWKLSFTLESDETIINEKDLQRAMIDAGALVGLGDWRPKFGRFLVK